MGIRGRRALVPFKEERPKHQYWPAREWAALEAPALCAMKPVGIPRITCYPREPGFWEPGACYPLGHPKTSMQSIPKNANPS